MNMLSLPDESVIHIFGNCIDSLNDLRNLMLTCHRFHDVIWNSNKIWTLVFEKRWPRINLNTKKQYKTFCRRETVAYRQFIKKEIRKALSMMSSLNYPVGQPELGFCDRLVFSSHMVPEVHEYLQDELVELVYHENPKDNLTVKYYARKLLTHLRMYCLERRWQDVLDQQIVYQNANLLEGAILISQWNSMEEENIPQTEGIRLMFETITKKVFETMFPSTNNERKCFGLHPKGIDAYIFNAITSINYVLYQDYEFVGVTNDSISVENDNIDKVLESRVGSPISLTIIYQELCQRVGIECTPIYFKHCLVLKCPISINKNDSNNGFIYIDPVNNGLIHSEKEILPYGEKIVGNESIELSEEEPIFPTSLQIYKRIIMNHIQSYRSTMNEDPMFENILVFNGSNKKLKKQLQFLRLYCIISPSSDYRVFLKYANLSLVFGEKLKEVIKILQKKIQDVAVPSREYDLIRSMLKECQLRFLEQQSKITMKTKFHRPPEIKYAIGMLMKQFFVEHFPDGSFAISCVHCVIIWWDVKCRKMSDECFNVLGVRNLTRGVNQPFYYIYTEDGNARYVAEDCLEIANNYGKCIDHPDIGLHFESFNGRRYIPHEEKKANYPEDEAVAIRLTSNE